MGIVFSVQNRKASIISKSSNALFLWPCLSLSSTNSTFKKSASRFTNIVQSAKAENPHHCQSWHMKTWNKGAWKGRLTSSSLSHWMADRQWLTEILEVRDVLLKFREPHLAGCEKIKLLQVIPHQLTFYLTFKLTWTMWHFMWHSIWHSTYSTWRSIWQIISHFIWHSYLTYVLLDIRFGSGIGELAMLFGSGKPARPYQFSEQHVSSNHHLGLASPPSSLTSLHFHFEASWCAFLRRFERLYPTYGYISKLW